MSEPALKEVVYAAEAGDAQARDRLFAILYDELHRLAQRELRRGGAFPLSPTTLLHETYLNISQRESVEFIDHARFMSYAARAMRGLIIDHLRRRQRQKRGGEIEIHTLATEPSVEMEGNDTGAVRIESLNDALDQLTQIDARLAECVDLKFFCGLSFTEIAKLRQVSDRTVQRDWDKARTLLNQLIKDQDALQGAS